MTMWNTIANEDEAKRMISTVHWPDSCIAAAKIHTSVYPAFLANGDIKGLVGTGILPSFWIGLFVDIDEDIKFLDLVGSDCESFGIPEFLDKDPLITFTKPVIETNRITRLTLNPSSGETTICKNLRYRLRSIPHSFSSDFYNIDNEF